ncbi:MAG: hypothetical protein WBA12_04850 [Catalinimonas sp.]
MSKSIKLSEEELDQFLEVYQEKKEALNAEMQQLKSRIASINDMIKQLQEAKGGTVAKAKAAEPKGKKRGPKPGSTRKRKTGSEESRVSFASRIVGAIESQDKALNASEIFEVMADSNPNRDAASDKKDKQNIHSNLNNLFKKGALKRVKDGRSFAYGLSDWFDDRGQIDMAHAPVRSEEPAEAEA